MGAGTFWQKLLNPTIHVCNKETEMYSIESDSSSIQHVGTCYDVHLAGFLRGIYVVCT